MREATTDFPPTTSSLSSNKFFISELCYPQTIDVLKTRAEPLGIELVIGDYNTVVLSQDFFGILLQYPAKYGEVLDYSEIVNKAKSYEAGVAVAADVTSSTSSGLVVRVPMAVVLLLYIDLVELSPPRICDESFSRVIEAKPSLRSVAQPNAQGRHGMPFCACV